MLLKQLLAPESWTDTHLSAAAECRKSGTIGPRSKRVKRSLQLYLWGLALVMQETGGSA